MSVKRSLPDELLQDDLGDDEKDNMDDGDEKVEEKDKKDEEEVIKLTKKPQKRSKPLTEDILTGADGLNRVYNEFPQISKFRGQFKTH